MRKNEEYKFNVAYWIGLVILLAILAVIMSWRFVEPTPGKAPAQEIAVKTMPGQIDWSQWDARNNWL